MSTQADLRVYYNLDEWAEAVAKMIVECGGYVPSNVPILIGPTEGGGQLCEVAREGGARGS